jgi:hypothetical protein
VVKLTLLLAAAYLPLLSCTGAAFAPVEQRTFGLTSQFDHIRPCIWTVSVDQQTNEATVAWSPFPCVDSDSVRVTIYKLAGDRPPCRVWILAAPGSERPAVTAELCRIARFSTQRKGIP